MTRSDSPDHVLAYFASTPARADDDMRELLRALMEKFSDLEESKWVTVTKEFNARSVEKKSKLWLKRHADKFNHTSECNPDENGANSLHDVDASGPPSDSVPNPTLASDSVTSPSLLKAPMEEVTQVFVPEGVLPGGPVQFPACDAANYLAYVPHGLVPGQTFQVVKHVNACYQPYCLVVPEGQQSGDAIWFSGFDGRMYMANVPEGVGPGESFQVLHALQKVTPPAPIEELDAEELVPWLEAARAFAMNTDFEVPEASWCDASKRCEDFGTFMNRMKTASDGKLTIQVLSDKLLLSQLLDNLDVPQMPLLFTVQDCADLNLKVADFVTERSQCDEALELFVKPSHLSSSLGILTLPYAISGKSGVFRPTSQDEKEMAVATLTSHIQKFMSMQAHVTESLALQSLRPGFLVQPSFRSVVGFDLPLELRLVTLWGRTRLAAWWWGREYQPPSSLPHRNAWITRRPHTRGKLSHDDVWEAVHEHSGENFGFHSAVALFVRHMPAMWTSSSGVLGGACGSMRSRTAAASSTAGARPAATPRASSTTRRPLRVSCRRAWTTAPRASPRRPSLPGLVCGAKATGRLTCRCFQRRNGCVPLQKPCARGSSSTTPALLPPPSCA